MPGALTVLVNAASGKGHSEDDIQALRALFEAAGLKAHIVLARSGEELKALAQRLALAKPAAIVAGGGDGTVNTVASVLVGTDIALGVLPLGTLNHFARDARIPADVGLAVQTIAAGYRAKVDVGEVNERIFLNNSSLGLYPELVHHRENQQRRLGRGKWHAMFWATLTTMRRYPFLSVRLRLDEAEATLRAPFIFIGNNEYVMEGFDIGRRPRLDAGVLSVYVTARRGRLGLVALALRALFGRLRQARDFIARTAHSTARARGNRWRGDRHDGAARVSNPARSAARDRSRARGESRVSASLCV